jgi:hypothetical protein
LRATLEMLTVIQVGLHIECPLFLAYFPVVGLRDLHPVCV